jgi:hypothetical protein
MPKELERPSHFDLMVEQQTNLRTWELKDWPDESVVVEAMRLADHRKAYLEFEGPISGGRGKVKRIKQGVVTKFVKVDSSLSIELQVVEAGHKSQRLRVIVEDCAVGDCCKIRIDLDEFE